MDLKPYITRWIKSQDATVVKDMREYTGWGLMDCKSYLNKAKLMLDIDNAATLEELKPLLLDMVARQQWVLR